MSRHVAYSERQNTAVCSHKIEFSLDCVICNGHFLAAALQCGKCEATFHRSLLVFRGITDVAGARFLCAGCARRGVSESAAHPPAMTFADAA